jgi:hypothetical protein
MAENKQNYTITILIAVIALGLGFGGGIFYQKSKTPNFNRNGQFQMGNIQKSNGQNGPSQGTGARNSMRFGGVGGEIISVDDKSITVKMNDGSSKIVLFSDKTQINKSTQGSTADLKSGETVMVMGDSNPDGSITAQNIQLNPVNRTINIPANQK